MVAQLRGVPRQVNLLGVGVVAVDRVEVRVDRNLRVDDDALAAGELDDQVGAEEPALVVAPALLGAKVAVLDHSRELDNAFQLHLAPAAPDVRGPERGHQVAGLRPEALLALGHRPQLLAHGRDRAQPPLLELLRLGLEPLERLLDRRELGLGELEQRRLVPRQRVAGDRLEALLPKRVRPFEQVDLAAGGVPVAVELRIARGERGARPEEDRGGTEGEAEEEKEDRHQPTNDREGVGRQKKSAPASPKTYRS